MGACVSRDNVTAIKRLSGKKVPGASAGRTTGRRPVSRRTLTLPQRPCRIIKEFLQPRLSRLLSEWRGPDAPPETPESRSFDLKWVGGIASQQLRAEGRADVAESLDKLLDGADKTTALRAEMGLGPEGNPLPQGGAELKPKYALASNPR